jgi:hypothetical protein
MKLPNWVLPGSAVFLLAACALLQSHPERIRTVAAGAGFFPVEVADQRLRAFLRSAGQAAGQNSKLTIYLESDGAPWRRPDEPPADPTPHKPMVLDMAIGDGSGAVAYLGGASIWNRRCWPAAIRRCGCVPASARMPSPPWIVR